jgi:hypothetical protein
LGTRGISGAGPNPARRGSGSEVAGPGSSVRDPGCGHGVVVVGHRLSAAPPPLCSTPAHRAINAARNPSLGCLVILPNCRIWSTGPAHARLARGPRGRPVRPPAPLPRGSRLAVGIAPLDPPHALAARCAVFPLSSSCRAGRATQGAICNPPASSDINAGFRQASTHPTCFDLAFGGGSYTAIPSIHVLRGQRKGDCHLDPGCNRP